MLTYQDFLNIGQSENERMGFVLQAINQHKESDLYKTAVLAEEYRRRQNRTITRFQKTIYSLSGKPMIDKFSANYKLASNFFNRFIIQENQYLLGNGVQWKDETTADKMGADFDNRLQELGLEALSGAVSFGFWNFDHLEAFKVTEFVPLIDEENGGLSAGIRFWQIDDSKPLRATLYELDGYTDYIWHKRALQNRSGAVDADTSGTVLHDKKTYIQVVRISDVDGVDIIDGENYPTFPIVPFWGNPQHQSELVGIREQIDAFDLIKSGFCNSVDEASMVYWLIQGASGMDDYDLTEFMTRIRTIHVASVMEGQSITQQTVESPYQSREMLLDRISKDLYRDAMALDTEQIAGGAITATQIKAAYEPLNNKVDQYEYCVLDFLSHIMKLAGVEDEPSFTRSMMVNAQENAQIVLQCAEYFDSEYTTRKLLSLLGDGDQADEVLERKDQEDMERMALYGRDRDNDNDNRNDNERNSEYSENDNS